jgi:hypothetical protein
MVVVAQGRADGTALPAASAGRTGAFVVPAYLACVALSERPAIDFFGLHLTPLRTFLLITMIPALVTLFRRRDVRFHVFDAAVVLLAFWLFLGLSVNNGIDRGFKYGGAVGLEAIGGYLIARAYIRSAAEFRRMLLAFLALIVIVGLFAIPEAVFGVRTFSFLGSGAVDVLALSNENSNYRRLGLFRASVTFDHPILYGAFCATALGMVWYGFAKNLRLWYALGAIFAATFLSVSSAPLLACFVVAAFIVWEKMSRLILQRAAITLWSVAFLAIVIEVFSTRSIAAVFLPFVSLDQWTAYYRLLIWEHASANILQNPLFGIGLNDWVRPRWMPPSVDCYWLVVGLIGGLPAVGFVVTFIVALLAQVHRRREAEPPERWQTRYAWTAGVLALCLMAFTVHYWGAMHSFFFFILGSGAWMVDMPRAVAARQPQQHLRGLVQRPRFIHESMLRARSVPTAVVSSKTAKRLHPAAPLRRLVQRPRLIHGSMLRPLRAPAIGGSAVAEVPPK